MLPRVFELLLLLTGALLWAGGVAWASEFCWLGWQAVIKANDSPIDKNGNTCIILLFSLIDGLIMPVDALWLQREGQLGPILLANACLVACQVFDAALDRLS